MSTTGAIANLGSQLVVFMTAVGLLVVVVARPDFLGATQVSRPVLAAASVLLAAGAVAQGVGLDLDPGAGPLTVLRVGALAGLLSGAFALPTGTGRRALGLAGLAMVVAEGAYVAGADTVGHVVRGVGAAAVGMAVALGARRSIATRIATASAALLLVVILVLSAVLSVVITGNVAREALQRADERAAIEAGIAAQQADEMVGQADFLAEVLGPSPAFRTALSSGDFTALSQAIDRFRSDYRQVDFIAFVDARGTARVGSGIDRSDLVGLAGSQVVADALERSDAASVELLGRDLLVVGAAPVSVPDARGAPQVAGVAVAGVRLNRPYLEVRLQRQRATAFSLVTGDRVLASTAARRDGRRAVSGVVGRSLAPAVAQQVLGAGVPVREETRVGEETAFVAVHPVRASDGRPVAAFVVSQGTSLVGDTRDSLFRTLFLVALGAGAVALAVAVAAGTRMAAPLRRLTEAARRIREGDLSVRAGVEAEDEVGILGSSFDAMTDSIEAMTREIREAAAQTAAILEGMAEGLVATDAEGTVVALNPAAERMLGRRESRAVGRPVASVLHVEDREGGSLSSRIAAPLTRPWSVGGFLRRRGGRLAVALSASPIRNERGEVIGRVYVMRDTQREAEVEAMKTEFLSNISHELRTPLTPIKGYTEVMLSKKVPPDRVRRFLENILEGAERLERYVDMLVNFAAMEAGRFELRTAPVDVGALVHRVGERWARRSDRHRLSMQAPVRLPRVVGDEGMLERALNELVDNAVKYSPDGGAVAIRARARGTGAQRRVEISVADEGIGFEAGDLEAIFADFSQVDGSATRRYGGLGLGLSFVNRVVRAHHGRLEAESRDGGGSEFTIVLPLGAPRPRARATPARGTRLEGKGKPVRAHPSRAVPRARVARRRPAR